MEKRPLEPIPPGELAQIDETAELTVKLQDQRYPEPDKALRGVHPKSHGCVNATFEINPDLHKTQQVGLFSTPGKKYEALIRFSNAAVRVDPDLDGFKHGSRGMAIKVLDVEPGAEMLQEDHGARNHDFLMINTPAFAFANVRDYLRLTTVIHENNDDPGLFFAPLNPEVPGFTDEERARTLRSFQVVQEIQSLPVANPLGVRYFSAAPYLFGPKRVMHFSVVPAGGEEPQLFPSDISENYLHNALRDRMKEKKEVVFDFQLQVRDQSEPDLGIEDATTVWDEKSHPFDTYARITIPPQVVADPKEGDNCEDMAFTPWHALPSHRPVGGINRLRKKVYIASADHRGVK